MRDVNLNISVDKNSFWLVTLTVDGKNAIWEDLTSEEQGAVNDMLDLVEDGWLKGEGK